MVEELRLAGLGWNLGLDGKMKDGPAFVRSLLFMSLGISQHSTSKRSSHTFDRSRFDMNIMNLPYQSNFTSKSKIT